MKKITIISTGFIALLLFVALLETVFYFRLVSFSKDSKDLKDLQEPNKAAFENQKAAFENQKVKEVKVSKDLQGFQFARTEIEQTNDGSDSTGLFYKKFAYVVCEKCDQDNGSDSTVVCTKCGIVIK